MASEGFDRVLSLDASPDTDAPAFTADDISDVLTRLSNSTLDPSTAPLALSGPLPPTEKKSPKKPVSHGRDIRSMFPMKSEELARRRLVPDSSSRSRQ